MFARLFCSIKKRFSRIPTVVILSFVFLLASVAGTGVIFAQYTTSGLDTTIYAPYVTNFTTSSKGTVSGITGGTAQNASANNTVVGLVFTVNLGINTTSVANDTIKNHWSRVNTSDPTDYGGFLIELCPASGNTTQCFLSTVPYTIFSTSATQTNGSLYQNILSSETQDPSNDNIGYIDDQSVAVNAFTSNNAYSSGHSYTYDAGSGTATSVSNPALPEGVPLTASLWYCASGAGANAINDYKKAVGNFTSPTTFGSLCSGASYFQVGSSLSLTIPTDATTLQQQSAASAQALKTNAATSSSETQNTLPACGFGVIGLGGTNSTILGCGADIAYGIYWLCAWVAGLFGELFDFFIGYSLSSTSYSYGFVVTGWKLVRDISNIFFIIIMVYAGFSAVFDTSATSMKKLVPNLIINAFLINFSLFFTRVAIDLSNITARVFYTEMVVCQQTDLVNGVCPTAKQITGTGGFPSLSVKIVSAFNPQDMFKPSVLNPPTTTTTNAGQNAVQTTTNTHTTNVTPTSPSMIAIYFGIVSLIAAAMMIALAIMFFKVAFLFLGRVVGLYICMIFSPFAFLSRNIDVLSKVPRLNWTKWFAELSSYALLAPVFVFFLYIILTAVSSNFVQQIGVQALQASGFFDTVMSIAIPMGIVYFLLNAAQKTAEGFSGDIGKSIQKYGETVTGFVTGAAVGVATGGASLVGTASMKAFALSDQRRTELQAQKAAGGIRGRMANLQLKASDWTQKQTFDARNTKGMQFLSQQFKMNTNNGVINTLGFGSKRTEGGREAMRARTKKKNRADIMSIKSTVTDDEAENYWNNKVTEDVEKAAKKAYFAEKEKNAITDEQKKALKEEKDGTAYKTNGDYTKLVEANRKKYDDMYGTVTNSEELTQALRLKYAHTLQNEADLGRSAITSVGRLIGVDAGRIALGAGAGGLILPGAGLVAGDLVEGNAKREDAGDYIKEQEKARKKGAEAALKEEAKKQKKKDQSEKLKEENDIITKELEVVGQTMEKEVEKIAQRNINANPENAAKTPEEKARLVMEEKARLQHKDNEVELGKAINEVREILKLDLSATQANIKSKNKEYQAKVRSKNGDEDDPEVVALRAELSNQIAQKNALQEKSKHLDPVVQNNQKERKVSVEKQIDQIKEDLEAMDDKRSAAKKARAEAEEKEIAKLHEKK